MAKVPVPFEEWRPDVATLDTKFATEVENVFAGVNSYLPFPSLLPFSGSSISGGNDEFTKVLLQLDGPTTTITDSNAGGSAHVWTVAGNATCNATSAVFGSALQLDGTGDWITTPDHADFALGSGDWTIDFWFNCTATPSARWLCGQCDNAGNATSTSFRILRLFGAGDVIQATVSVGGTNYLCTSTTGFTDTTNAGWHHLAFVRSGNTLLLFIDGNLEASNGAISGTINNSTNALRVGAGGEIAADNWKGAFDAFRISSKARWISDFTVPSAPYFNAGGRACGLYAARTASGEWKIYAGTATKLLSWGVTGWTDVSRLVGGAYSVATNDLWMWAQFGTKLIAVNAANEPQVIDIDSGSNFANLAGSPPKATNVAVIGDFVVLSGLSGTTGIAPDDEPVNNRCIVWSGINDAEMWTVGSGGSLCDMQEFPDGGPVQGVAGSEIGYVVQDRAIRTMQFLPGDTTFIFNFSRVLSDRGCISKYGFSTIGNNLYFVAEDGFYSVTGQQVTPIGQDKINEWWLQNTDATRRNVIHCLSTVNKPRIVWVMHNSSASPMYDREIIFDWSNARWTKAAVSGQVFALLASTNLDLDTTGAEPGDVSLDSAALPLDSFAYVGGRPLIGAFNPDGYLSTLTGPNMPATMETAEVHLAPGMRAFVSEAYPLDDSRDDATGTVAAATRERLQDGIVWGTPVTIEITGSAALYSSSRLHRFRRFIPAATVWTHAQGVVIEAQQDGSVA